VRGLEGTLSLAQQVGGSQFGSASSQRKAASFRRRPVTSRQIRRRPGAPPCGDDASGQPFGTLHSIRNTRDPTRSSDTTIRHRSAQSAHDDAEIAAHADGRASDARGVSPSGRQGRGREYTLPPEEARGPPARQSWFQGSRLIRAWIARPRRSKRSSCSCSYLSDQKRRCRCSAPAG
jgi:hypothetical protein